MVASNFFKNRFRKGKGKAKKAKVVKTPRPTFAARVNQIIARNVENKYTETKLYEAPVCVVTNTLSLAPSVVTYEGYAWSPADPLGSAMLNISQGTSIQTRLGNKIKLKKWIIKGLVQPNKSFDYVPATNPPTAGNTVGILQNSFCGYVTIYFGKYQNNQNSVQPDLINFYQSGATDITPTGKQIETLYKVNKDLYKVYFRKRFKMGTGLAVSKEPQVGSTAINSGITVTPNVPSIVSQANDFNLTRSFGFDVTKYILKNKVLLYDELVASPQNADVQNLTIWATFHSAAGDLTGTVPTNIASTTNNSFYNLSCMSFAEFEDA